MKLLSLSGIKPLAANISFFAWIIFPLEELNSHSKNKKKAQIERSSP